MNESEMETWLAALSFFASIMRDPPPAMFLAKITEEDLFDHFLQWSCFGPDSESDINILRLDAKGRDAEDWAMKLAEDHLRLFSGPQPLSPPWESVWCERDGLLFGEQTEKVRHIYQEWGLTAENEGREPEDHLSMELGFLAFLLSLPPDARSASNSSPETALHSFLHDHCDMWIPQCLDTASENAESVFYASSCRLCSTILKNLEQILK